MEEEERIRKKKALKISYHKTRKLYENPINESTKKIIFNCEKRRDFLFL